MAFSFARCLNTKILLCLTFCNVSLSQYAVKTKQRTIAKLEEMVSEEERRAKLAETKLEEDAIAFDEFLKENDRRSVDALKRLDTLLQFLLLITS